MNPKISIITVCYNSEAHIEEAIQSVINQPYENKEYVVIDGGSTDGTLDIITKYRDKINYFVSEPDKGISDAFNKGIKAATGDVIGIINSDDKLAERALQVVAENYNPNIDCYRGICNIWNDKTGFIFSEHPTLYWPKIPIKMRAAHPATFVPKETYKKWGIFDVTLKYAMDTDLFLRLSRNNANIKYISEPLAYFRLGGVSQSSESRRLKELKVILKKNGSNWGQVQLFACYYRLRLLFKHIIMFIGGNDARFLFTKKF